MPDELDRAISALEQKLATLDADRARIIDQLGRLRKERSELVERHPSHYAVPGSPTLFEDFDATSASDAADAASELVADAPKAQRTSPLRLSKDSSTADKITFFRSLFRGREDVYARRFESHRTGRSGYAPACRNEWVAGICGKPRIACQACENRAFLPVTDRVIRKHMLGRDPEDAAGREFTVGIYPMLRDETCWFLAVDFDKTTWKEDTTAYLDTCRQFAVPAALERSRSGNGGHVWTFFSEPVSAALARRMGAFLLTCTMEQRPEIGFDSYDRFFPSQDTLPDGGFGNLIALPLQNRPARDGSSLFVDERFQPYADQWAFLQSIGRMSLRQVRDVLEESEHNDLALRIPIVAEHAPEPWKAAPSRRPASPPVTGPLPEEIEAVMGNQLYLPKADLSPSLKNQILRIAAFQNPEFYRAQAMRMSTYGKPRVISSAQEFPEHLGLPRGCVDDVRELLENLDIRLRIDDQRCQGSPLDVRFRGILRPEQRKAAEALLEHDIGILSAATAFGKSVVGSYLIAQRKVSTLVVVHRRQLLEQWLATLSRFLDVEAIGVIGGGRHTPIGRIDVAMIQSLVRKRVVNDVVAEYGHVIVDECHHISAVSFERAVREAKARYVTGLSATVVRKDGHHPILFMQCGPVRYRVDDRRQASCRPFDHRVIVRTTDAARPPGAGTEGKEHIQQVYSMLAEDEDRNRMIVRDVIDAVEGGRSPVVLTERRNHVDALARALSEHIPNVFAMVGGMGKRQRRELTEAMDAVPEDAPRVIVSTGRFLGEGFDDERLDTLFLTLPISWRGTLIQYAGRLHRVHDGKNDVIIYDYVDRNIPVLARMHGRRRVGYRSLGYEIAETAPTSRQLSFGTSRMR